MTIRSGHFQRLVAMPKPEDFADTFAEARRQGLRVVAHAGETAGPHSVLGAIKSLNAERIGHGVRCLEDPALVSELRARETPLEVSFLDADDKTAYREEWQRFVSTVQPPVARDH